MDCVYCFDPIELSGYFIQENEEEEEQEEEGGARNEVNPALLHDFTQ